MLDRAELLVAPEELVPVRVLRHGGASARPVGEVLELPEVNDLVEQADLAREEADQMAEVLQLHRQAVLLVELQPTSAAPKGGTCRCGGR